MIYVKHKTQCAGVNDPSKQISKDAWNEDHEVEGLLDAVYPVGSVYLAMVNVSPNTLFGGTWEALGAGFALVTVDAADAAIDAAGKTTGANAATPAGAVSQPTFAGNAANLAHTGSAVADHVINQVLNHTHPVVITDGGHNHAQASQTATTGAASSWEHGAIDTSSTAAETLPTGNATTGITAATSNPAGGVASITLAHSVTQPNSHAYTPAGTVSQPTFTGQALSVRQKSIALYAWQRTA